MLFFNCKLRHYTLENSDKAKEAEKARAAGTWATPEAAAAAAAVAAAATAAAADASPPLVRAPPPSRAPRPLDPETENLLRWKAIAVVGMLERRVGEDAMRKVLRRMANLQGKALGLEELQKTATAAAAAAKTAREKAAAAAAEAETEARACQMMHHDSPTSSAAFKPLLS